MTIFLLGAILAHAPRRRHFWIASSSADRKRERSRWAIGFGPPVTSPMARRFDSSSRLAIAMPIDAGVNGTPVLPITDRAGLEAAVGERDVGGDDDVARPGPLGDPVVGGIEAVAHHDQLDAADRAARSCRSC